jgi:drug/metabolite transporter (DMT)-like permease
MPLRKLLAYACIYLLWGGSFLAIRELVGGHDPIPPFFAAGFRFAVAGLALLVWSLGAERSRPTGRQALASAGLGLVMFTCEYSALFWAETRVTSGIAAVVSAMIPVWIFAGELWVLRTQRASALAVGGIGLGFAGVVLLALPGSAGSSSAVAILVMVVGALCWSAGTLASRRIEIPASQKTNAGLQMLCGGVLLLVLSLAVGEAHRMPPPNVLLSARVLGSMAYLVIAASIISYTAYVWLLTHDSPTRVASYAYVNPVIALIVGAALAGERLSVVQGFGAVLVVAGVFATLKVRNQQATAPVRSGRECESEQA